MSTTSEEESSAKEASAADNSTTPSSSVEEQKDKDISVATSSAKESRENFLRRLEQSKKNNDPLPVSHEAEKKDDIKIDDIVAGFCNSEEKKKLTAGKDMAVKNRQLHPLL